MKVILEHISTIRLFDASRSDLKGQFELEKCEQEHLAECAECRHVKEVFDRQFTAKADSASPDSAA